MTGEEADSQRRGQRASGSRDCFYAARGVYRCQLRGSIAVAQDRLRSNLYQSVQSGQATVE